MKNKIDSLVEWAVWGHLDNKKDLDLILLKGHLLLEVVLDTALTRMDANDPKNLSFYRKVEILEKCHSLNDKKVQVIIKSLKDLNKLRNELAHEFHFEIANANIEFWASDIIDNLQGKKFSRYTYRTKIVHGFSILSKNLLEITEEVVKV